MDLAGKDVAGNGEEVRVAVSGPDSQPQLRHEEQPAPDHVSRGLAVGHLIREVEHHRQWCVLIELFSSKQN
jgi:aquaporin NIP